LSAAALPQTSLGSLQRSRDPLGVFRGPILKGEEGREEGEKAEFVLCRRKKKEKSAPNVGR